MVLLEHSLYPEMTWRETASLERGMPSREHATPRNGSLMRYSRALTYEINQYLERPIRLTRVVWFRVMLLWISAQVPILQLRLVTPQREHSIWIQTAKAILHLSRSPLIHLPTIQTIRHLPVPPLTLPYILPQRYLSHSSQHPMIVASIP